MIKEQTFHGDASAKPVVFATMTDSGATFAVFEAAGKRISVEKSKIAALVQVPDAMPVRITGDAEIAPMKKSLVEMQEFSKRFPQSEKLIANQIDALTEHVRQYESGHVRIDSKWITKAEFTALNRELDEKGAVLKAEELDQIREKKEFEESQQAKGLIWFEGEWLKPEDLAKIREQRAEALKKLRAVPLPLVVTENFRATCPGGGVAHRIIQFKTGQRFALLPAIGGSGGLKYQTLRFDDESLLTGYRELPALGSQVKVDLAALQGMQPATVEWNITLQPVAGVERVKKVSICYKTFKPAIPAGHPSVIAMIVKRGEANSTEARLISWSIIADANPPIIETTLKSFDQVKEAMAHGVVLVDGSGNTTAPAFPQESDLPQMPEISAALSAFAQFQMSQDLVATRIKSLEMEINSTRKQDQTISSALAKAQQSATNARAKMNGTNTGLVIRARAEYEAAQSEARVLKAQSEALRVSINGLWKQVTETKRELVKIE